MDKRRSARARKATQKATEFSVDEEIFGSPEPPSRIYEDDSSDEFDATQIVEDDPDDDVSENEQVAADEAEDASVASGQDEGNLSDVLPNEPTPDDQPNPLSLERRTVRRGTKALRRKTMTEDLYHSRGVAYHKYPVKERSRYAPWITGKDPIENQLFVDVLRKFYEQVALPSRRITGELSGGMCLNMRQSDESLQEDAQKAWTWLTHGLGQWLFQRLQKHETLSDETLQHFESLRKTSDLVTGKPLGFRYMNFSSDHSIDVDKLFGQTPLTQLSANHQPRRGWLINIGMPVGCLAWVPNQPGSAQYLAVCPAPSPSSVRQRGSAFAPAESSVSYIYVLEFVGSDIADEGSALTIDTTRVPGRILTLCGDWGRILQIQWCPVPRHDLGVTPDGTRAALGLLAIVSADGNVRVLSVSCPPPSSTEPEATKVTRCAFQARPPGTVCTSVAWASSTLIVAGCANGYIAIWDLERHFATPVPPANAVPEFYHHLHATYIISVTTCYPSHPHLIASSSMDGFMRVTDIRDPTSDVVSSVRSRSPLSSLQWLDNCLCFIGTDDACMLKGMHLRLVEHYVSIIKFSSTIVSVSSSPVHSCVLVGSADGTVGTTGAVRRLFMERKQLYYRQVWFKNEWRRPRPTSDQHSSDAAQDTAGGLDFANGLSRIVTGFKLENMRDTSTNPPRRILNGTRAREEKASVTIYERESAITNVAWNPNLQAGGWAAATTGAGLLLVEDLCFD